MISAYGATPHKAEVSRVLGESKGAGVRAVKNLIAKNRAVEAFGASSSFKAPAAYLADELAARVGPLLANIHSWDFDMWAVVDAVGDQRLAAKVLADEVLVKARDLAPGPYGAVVRTCVDAIVAGYEDVAYHNCLHGADCMQSPGQHKRAKFPTSKAPISAVFHSFWLIFGRAIISRNGLEAWMLFPERARAEHSC